MCEEATFRSLGDRTWCRHQTLAHPVANLWERRIFWKSVPDVDNRLLGGMIILPIVFPFWDLTDGFQDRRGCPLSLGLVLFLLFLLSSKRTYLRLQHSSLHFCKGWMTDIESSDAYKKKKKKKSKGDGENYTYGDESKYLIYELLELVLAHHSMHVGCRE